MEKTAELFELLDKAYKRSRVRYSRAISNGEDEERLQSLSGIVYALEAVVKARNGNDYFLKMIADDSVDHEYENSSKKI